MIKINLVSVFCRTEKMRAVLHCFEHDCSHPLGWGTCMVPVVTVSAVELTSIVVGV